MVVSISNTRYGLQTRNIDELELDLKDTLENIEKLEDNIRNGSLYDIAELERLNNLYISIRQRITELRG